MKHLKLLFLALIGIALVASPALAKEVYLVAKEYTKLIPAIDAQDLNVNAPTSHDAPDQDKTATGFVQVEDAGATLHMNGNRWQKISLPYTVTANTILEFDFRADAQGELQGIGFDDDDEVNNNPVKLFKLYGTQACGGGYACITAYEDYAASAPGWKHYTIRVGDHYTGGMAYVIFANDHDTASPTADSRFRNVRVYEDDQVAKVRMWGFAEDADCDLSTDGLEEASSPGPAITLTSGDRNLIVWLRNDLDVPVSLVIPGQEMPYSAGNNGPTWTDGSIGDRTDLAQRVRSFGREAAANGGIEDYRWTAYWGNQLEPGTYLYHSGTDPSLQVHMGLYGAVLHYQNQANGVAYPGVTFNDEVVLFYSEIDPALHDPPAAAKPLGYKPQYFLVNGEPFDPSDPDSQRLTGLLRKSNVLIRFLNAGLDTHVPQIDGEDLSVRAEDGNLYPYAKDQYSVALTAMKTMDAIFRTGTAKTYPIYDRRLSLTSGPNAAGGMLSYLDISDTVEIVRVRYNGGLGQLRVWANSDATGEVLNLAECGAPMDELTANDNFDYRLFCTVPNPGSANVASDGGGSDGQGVPYTAPPKANDDDLDAASGISVLANDRKGGYFAAGDTLEAVLVNDASHGSVVLNPDGTFTYTPSGAGPCTDRFTYRAVANGIAESGVATVTVHY